MPRHGTLRIRINNKKYSGSDTAFSCTEENRKEITQHFNCLTLLVLLNKRITDMSPVARGHRRRRVSHECMNEWNGMDGCRRSTTYLTEHWNDMFWAQFRVDYEQQRRRQQINNTSTQLHHPNLCAPVCTSRSMYVSRRWTPSWSLRSSKRPPASNCSIRWWRRSDCVRCGSSGCSTPTRAATWRGLNCTRRWVRVQHLTGCGRWSSA